MTHNFAINAVDAFMQSKSLSELVSALKIAIEEETTIPNHSISRMFDAAKHIGVKESSRNGVMDSNRLIDHQFFGQNGFLDNDSLRAKGVDEGKCPISSHQIVIPIVVDMTTSKIYILEEGNGILFELKMDFSSTNIVADALYIRISHKIKNGVPANNFLRKNIVCGVLLQHPIRTSFYYAVTMDWKEMVFCDNVFKFVHPQVNNAIPENETGVIEHSGSNKRMRYTDTMIHQ